MGHWYTISPFRYLPSFFKIMELYIEYHVYIWQLWNMSTIQGIEIRTLYNQIYP